MGHAVEKKMLGVIGGTGLYKMDGLQDAEEVSVSTPYGDPSAKILLGTIGEQRVAFLPRHGEGHRLLPSEINFRANVWALKAVGVRRILGVSAVGSLRGEICPGDLVLPSQYVDWTKGTRAGTFFGGGLVAHVSTANPSCPALQGFLEAFILEHKIRLHTGKTYVCVEGPRLGTRAESNAFRTLGFDIVGMTNVPEAFLAREAQLCYSCIGIATDYDCWMEDPSQHASVDKVMELYHKNLERIHYLIRNTAVIHCSAFTCECRKSLSTAVVSREEGLSGELKRRLEFLKL